MSENLLSLLKVSLSEIKLELVPKNLIRKENEVHYTEDSEGKITLFVGSSDYNRVCNHLIEDYTFFKGENNYELYLYSDSVNKWYL